MILVRIYVICCFWFEVKYSGKFMFVGCLIWDGEWVGFDVC